MVTSRTEEWDGFWPHLDISLVLFFFLATDLLFFWRKQGIYFTFFSLQREGKKSPYGPTSLPCLQAVLGLC